MKFTNVNECIKFIETRKRFRSKADLTNMQRLCDVFGNPHQGLKYIHITGTNGKGSTSLFITNVLIDAGYNVGTFVSPYVTCFNERIEYNKNYIKDEELLDIMNIIYSKEELFDNSYIDEPSFFELCTLIAFIYFKKKNPDFVILEVGMGGAFDSTNIITPLLSIITNVKLDHMSVLGNTVQEICLNKLGIVKEGRPLFTLSDPKLNEMIKDYCIKKNSQLYLINPNDITNCNISLNGTKYDYNNLCNISLKLLGKHQTENATLALEALLYLSNLGYNIFIENIYSGLSNTIWPGRLEIISQHPLIILDGAHNIDGITRLKEFIQDIKLKKYLKIIFAVSSDKEKSKMISLLDDVCDELVLTQFTYKRSNDANALYEMSHNKNKRILDSVSDVYNEIIRDNDKIIICCGSLYFISELRKYFN